MHSIRSLGGALINIFIPIYFLEIGYSFQEMIMFFILLHLIGLICSFFVGKIAQRTGYIRLFFVSIFFTLLYYILLHLLDSASMPTIIVALAGGMSSAFYWIPFHVLFVRFTNHEKYATETGKLFALPKFAQLFAPLIGGGLIIWQGFLPAFIASGILLLLSLLPLQSIQDKRAVLGGVTANLSFSKGWELLRKFKRYFVGEIIDNIEQETSWLWPIFIYLNLLTILSVGFVGTISAVASIIIILLLGSYLDRHNKLPVLRIGAILKIVSWIGRIFGKSSIVLYGLTLFGSLVNPVLTIPYNALLYQNAQKDDINFIVFREIPVVIGRMIMFTLALIFATQLHLVFAIVAMLYLYFVFAKFK
jgi:MFS family permease